MKRVVLVTGGFDPIHSGHIAYFKAAQALGDILVVGVNSDAWLERKKTRAFMPWEERANIVESLEVVDYVIAFDDTDGSAVDAIRRVKELYPNDKIIFANGGDRTDKNIPEMSESGVEFVFGVGGQDKKNSSSWILEEWKAPKTERAWGHYSVLHQVGSGTKLKELTVNPGSSLSMQRHTKRSEFWFVAEGEATVYTLDSVGKQRLIGKFTKHKSVWISQTQWHMLQNDTDRPLKLIEIQYGNDCVEEDIQRK